MRGKNWAIVDHQAGMKTSKKRSFGHQLPNKKQHTLIAIGHLQKCKLTVNKEAKQVRDWWRSLVHNALLPFESRSLSEASFSEVENEDGLRGCD